MAASGTVALRLGNVGFLLLVLFACTLFHQVRGESFGEWIMLKLFRFMAIYFLAIQLRHLSKKIHITTGRCYLCYLRLATQADHRLNVLVEPDD